MNVQAICPCGSGKTFGDCHAKAQLPGSVGPPAGPTSIVYAGRTITRRLDLACGQSPADGMEGCDVWAGKGVAHVFDLMRFPWPFEDSSVVELRSSHFIEHIPMVHVDPSGNIVPMGSPGCKDALFAFFDEAYRILVPGGHFTVIAPCASSNRAFQDPTHRRFIVPETYQYMNKRIRDGNLLDHYNVQCDFVDMGIVPILSFQMDQALKALHQDAQMARVVHERNVIQDWQAFLKSNKPSLEPGPATS